MSVTAGPSKVKPSNLVPDRPERVNAVVWLPPYPTGPTHTIAVTDDQIVLSHRVPPILAVALVETFAKLFPNNVINVPPVVGALNAAVCESVGESYVKDEKSVDTTLRTCMRRYDTVPWPAGVAHVADEEVVHETVPHRVAPSRNDGVWSKKAKLLPWTVNIPSPEVAPFDGDWNETTGASYENIASCVDWMAERVSCTVNSVPDPAPVAQVTWVLVFHDIVLHSVAPTRVVADILVGPKLNPRSVMYALPDSGVLAVSSWVSVGAS